jgi:hypothetical protein
MSYNCEFNLSCQQYFAKRTGSLLREEIRKTQTGLIENSVCKHAPVQIGLHSWDGLKYSHLIWYIMHVLFQIN